MIYKQGQVVIVEGNIGAGKSTFAEHLGQEIGQSAAVMLEPDESNGGNPYLADFYADMPRWALTLQLHQLHVRLAHQKLATQKAFHGQHAILDRSYYGDTCFARMLNKKGIISDREFKTYEISFNIMSQSVPLPSACVYLDTEPEVCLSRIERRYADRPGRKCETIIDIQYLTDLRREIDVMVSSLEASGVSIVKLRTSGVGSGRTAQQLAAKAWGSLKSLAKPSLVRSRMRQA